MKLEEQKLNKVIQKFNLQHRQDVISFIKKNPESLGIDELSRIAELVNNSRVDTAAYYTDFDTLRLLSVHLPDIKKDVISVLEPSVGVGNFIQIIINKYSHAKKLVIDVNDIDEESIELTKALNQHRIIPDNVEINYNVGDFLTEDFSKKYDLIVGNPPFLKLKRATGLSEYANQFDDSTTTNLSGFFIQKACWTGEHIVMIMPKYLLNNPDFKETRSRINKFAIDKIIDFGEKGFRGVLIETISLVIDTQKKRGKTFTYSVTKKIENIVKQSEMTSEEYPSWLLYRNDFFDKIANCMEFGVFKVYRDRQLTNSIMKSSGDIRVLKSRNINRDGSGFTSIPGYDGFIDSVEANKYIVSKYLDRDDVYLSPNMTYYPRVIKKPKNTLVNGSVAILEKKISKEISDKQLNFLSGKTFEDFYRIARNYSTRSLNIDSSSVYFFGLYNNDGE